MSDINPNRMIPLHVADAAVAACEKEIQKLRAEVERLRASSFVTAVPVEEYEKLKAENERLRKAGDELLNAFYCAGCSECEGMFNDDKVDEKWNAAKEGKPSV